MAYTTKSVSRRRRDAARRKAQEERWAARASKVVVSHFCEVENCNGECGKWHRL